MLYWPQNIECEQYKCLSDLLSDPEYEGDVHCDEDRTEQDEYDDVAGVSEIKAPVSGDLWNDGVPDTHQHQHRHRRQYVHVLRYRRTRSRSNIRINFTSPETRVIGVHFCRS